MSDTDQQLIGVCKSINEKDTGFTDVEVEVENWDYPTIRLGTKIEALIVQAREMKSGGVRAVWSYKEKPSTKTNPNTGQPYPPSRYLNGVEAAGDSVLARPTGSGKEPHHSPLIAGDKDRAITRMACLKAAAELYSAGRMSKDDGEDPPLGVMKAATRFEKWVMRDIDEVPSDAGRPPLSEHDDSIPY